MLVLLATVDLHSWPSAHLHGRFLWLNCVTVVGSNNASATRSGRTVAKSLKPGNTAREPQKGQPFPPDRLLTPADHSCPRVHRHATRLLLPALSVVGSNSASRAKSGWVVCRSLKPGSTALPAQNGQPLPFARFDTDARQPCPNEHLHGRIWLDPAVTVVASNSASAARSGLTVARSLYPASTA